MGRSHVVRISHASNAEGWSHLHQGKRRIPSFSASWKASHLLLQLAQWAASRQDLFPAGMCESFGQLHSAGKHHPLWHTKHIIENVFKRPFDEVFVSFDEDPIGVGAIGQVYRASLNPDLIPAHYLNPKHSREHQRWPKGLVDVQRALVSLDIPPPTVPS